MCFQQGVLCGEWFRESKAFALFAGESLVCIKVVAVEVMKSSQTRYVLEKYLIGLDDGNVTVWEKET